MKEATNIFVIVVLFIISTIAVITLDNSDRYLRHCESEKDAYSETMKSRDSIAVSLLCQKLKEGYIKPWKPAVQFDGVTYVWFQEANRYVSEKDYKEWNSRK